MFNVVLIEPEIPPNTGNVIRLCANTGAQLHLIEPLGFGLDDKQLRRAGLDYREYASIKVHPGFDALLAQERCDRDRMFALTTRASRTITEVRFEPGDWLLFGAETRGLRDDLRGRFAPSQCVRLPMRAGNRSLNLSNAVAIVVYEAWRQNGYAGAA